MKETTRLVDAAPIRVAILHEGAHLTDGARDAVYGPPSINMGCAGELKQVMQKYIGSRYMSLAEREALEMALTKLGRIFTGHSVHRDNYVDAATYIAIAGECAIGADAVEESNHV